MYIIPWLFLILFYSDSFVGEVAHLAPWWVCCVTFPWTFLKLVISQGIHLFHCFWIMQNTPPPPKGLYISTNPLYITQEPITQRLTSSCQRCYDWIVPSFSHQRGHYSKLAYKFKPGQMDLSHSTRLHRLPDRLRQHCVMEIRHLSQLRLGQLLYEWGEERLKCLQ